MLDGVPRAVFSLLAGNARLARVASRYGMRRPSSFARRFVAGETIAEAIDAARVIEAQGLTTAEVEKQLADGNTIRHIVDASEVAYVVTFLCSPKSIAINGDVIAAGGGALRAIHY